MAPSEQLDIATPPKEGKVMTFKVEGSGKTIEGTVTCQDGDETTHLPMMLHGILKQLTESVPELCQATTLQISASFQ